MAWKALHFFRLGFRVLEAREDQPRPDQEVEESESPGKTAATGRIALGGWAAIGGASLVEVELDADLQSLLLLFLLFGLPLILLFLSMIVYLLRRKENLLYWEVACWVLVGLGIASRQSISISPALAFDPAKITPSLLLVSALIGLAVFPALQRWLNRVKPIPGLAHVATPFSLGFFLDLAQVLANSYALSLPWV
ncbi:MAG TPA: hypothetical protein VLV83_19090 [Acidobacteriota bacterium]|nr:hypothetical protein [Acidobacteriota bacterium]